ncbi:MAG: ABC transporter ATP-binding protein [Clostridia bacterium]|nr:ABC transporter ATP-binding protein [Clostridia bacterium]
MARTLEQLQSRYNKSAESGSLRGRPGRGPGRGPARFDPKQRPKIKKDTVKRLLSYLAAYKGRLVLVFAFMLASTAASIVGTSAIARIIDGLVYQQTRYFFRDTPFEIKFETTASYLLAVLLLIAGIYVVGIACTYFQARIMLTISQDATEKIRNDLFDKLQTLPIRYFDNNPTGEVMSRFTNDVDNIDMMLSNTVTSLVAGIIEIVGYAAAMFVTHYWLAFAVICFVPLFIRLGGMIAKSSAKYYVAQQAALGAVNGYVEESVTGAKVIKVFNHEQTANEEFMLLNDDMRNKQFKAQFFGGIMGPILGNSSQISYAIVSGIGGLLCLLLPHEFVEANWWVPSCTVGVIAAFAQFARRFAMPINNISQQTSTIFAALAGAERVFAVIDADPEKADPDDALGCENIKGDVVFENVSFGYIPEKIVLKNVSLYAHPGQKIAFVGSTGAGKTTVTNLLNRFYDIEEGSITIDGIDVKKYKREELRKSIAMVLQDTHLFTGTVMENIRYGRLDATDEEVIEAAKTASAHSFIMRLEHGYDTVIEGDGANLSQGQRQLLNIARAAISKAPILVLDEATSSVDTRTERHIDHGMDRLMKNRTTFVIAHRLSTVRNANAIMVLEHGEIIERGTHEQLLEMKGRYYELYTGKKELD